MARLTDSLRRFYAQPQVREFLWWCLPALLVGFALRALLMAQMPYAVYHDDTSDLLTTPQSLLTLLRWEISGKKTFLVPVLYTAPALLRIPLLLAVPVLQHIFGVVLIALVGLLCRLWFARWRWFILPITLLIAVNPALLWYEHLLMAESAYVFCTVLLAVAGTLYALNQSNARFAFLCVALFLEAGARPEGKLLFGFGFFLLLLLHGRAWRKTWARFAILLAVAIGTFLVTRTGQAGLLLYTSVVRMTPNNLKSAPGFEPFIDPIRTDLQARWARDLSFPKVADRRLVANAVESYLKAQDSANYRGHADTNAFCLKLASETCRKNLLQLPAHFYQKFRCTTGEPTFGLFDQRWLFERQKEAFLGNRHMTSSLPRIVTGADVGEEEAYTAFLAAHYRELTWFNTYADAWNDAIYALRFPDERRSDGSHTIRIRRLPVFYVVAALGLVAVMFRRGILQPFHVAWGLALLALFFTIVLTANVRGRFRFGLEPFWYLYLGLLLDSLACRLIWKRATPAAPAQLQTQGGDSQALSHSLSCL